MNRVVLVGRLTKDPELRTTKSGTNQTTFTMAINRRTTDENGERQADFINCIAWNKQAEAISKYLKKGSQVAIEGRIQTGNYEKDGVKHYTTDVIVQSLNFIGTKEKEDDIFKGKSSVKTDEIELAEEDYPF